MGLVGVLAQMALLWWLSEATSDSPAPSDNAVSASSYCVFLESSLELDCVCSEWTGRAFSFPPKDLLLHAPNVTLASVKLHSCDSMRVALHFTQMTNTFRRLRIEDVPEVTVEGISLVSSNSVELWFRNINTSLVLTGAIDCNGCDVDLNETTNASFSMHLLDVRNISVQTAYVSLCPQIRVRGAHSVTLQDSYFRWVPHNGIEIFNASNVTLLRTELAEAGRGAVTLQRVSAVSVLDSLVQRSAVEVVRNETPIVWQCTLAADGSHVGMTDEETAACAVEGRLMTSLGGTSSSSEQWLAPSGGAIVLASVSAAMLVLAVGILVFMHRTGKLEQYL